MNLLYMVYSDQCLMPHLKALKPGQIVTARQLSKDSGVPYSTVRRRLGLMERAGLLERKSRGRRWGSTYRVCA